MRNEPVMRQLEQIRSRFPDTLILCRLGDFYEAYAQDAHAVADTLGITISQRAYGVVTGFPYRALEDSVTRLTQAGHTVAVCE